MDTGLRAMGGGDGAAVLRIYQEGIDTGHATFQEFAPPWKGWTSAHLPTCRLVATDVATDGGRVLGWAALSAVSARPVYAGVAEVSVYVAAAARGRGCGHRLLGALVGAAEAAGIWTLQAGIFPENEASIALHAAHGFRVVGTRVRIGRMGYGPFAGRWRDVVLMERRSETTGVA